MKAMIDKFFFLDFGHREGYGTGRVIEANDTRVFMRMDHDAEHSGPPEHYVTFSLKELSCSCCYLLMFDTEAALKKWQQWAHEDKPEPKDNEKFKLIKLGERKGKGKEPEQGA